MLPQTGIDGKRYKYRLEKHPPVLEAFWAWLDKQHPTKGSRMEKAVNYVRNRRENLKTYLEDGRCSFSNNLSENAIRPFTVGRKIGCSVIPPKMPKPVLLFTLWLKWQKPTT